MKKRILSVALASGIVLALPTAAIAQPDHSVTASAAQAQASTQEQTNLFKALYFGVGPTAQAFESTLDDSSYTAFRDAVANVGVDMEAVETLIADLEQASPGFLATWHKDITSGDVLRVEAAFASGTDRLNDQAANESKSSAMAVDPDAANPTAVVPVAVVWVAVVESAGAVHALTLAVQANVAWTANAFWSAAPNGEATLENEKGIVNLTEALQSL